MSVNGYNFCNLNKNDLKKIKDLEKDLNKEEPKEDIILLAFNKKE